MEAHVMINEKELQEAIKLYLNVELGITEFDCIELDGLDNIYAVCKIPKKK